MDKTLANLLWNADAWYLKGYCTLRTFQIMRMQLNRFIKHWKYTRILCQHSIYKGCTLFELGMVNEAVVSYDNALVIQPKHIEALYHKGLALTRLSCYDLAITSYDLALRLRRQLHLFWTGKGVALSALGQDQDAISLL